MLCVHEASRCHHCQLRDVRAPQCCSRVVLSACVVDAGRVWRTQPESGIHWLVVVFVWGHGWNLSIRFLFTLCQPIWPAASLRFQHRVIRRDHCYLPFREHSRCGWRWPKSDRMAAHNFAAVVILRFRYGIQ